MEFENVLIVNGGCEFVTYKGREEEVSCGKSEREEERTWERGF